MKKIISIALALLMVAVMLPVMAMADDVYTTLPTASNGEISLDKDVVLSVTAEITSNVTINFNGHTIKNGTGLTGYAIDISAAGATVTMKGGTIEDSRTNESGTITTIRNLGTLTLENMTISRGVGIAVKNDEAGPTQYGKLTVTNCTITAGSNQIRGQAIQNWGEATIESGIFNADVNAWAYKGGHAGSTTINGGTFNCNVQSLQLNYKDTGWPTTPAQTNINGGTFKGNVATGHQVGDQPSDAVPAPADAISANMGVAGGTFNSDVTEYAGDTLVVENNGTYYVGGTAKNAVENATSGTFTVKKAENGTSLTVKPGVTVKNESNGNLTVNGNEVAPEKSYTVPGTITIIVPSEGGSTTTTPSTDNTKNPSTGANDFVGVAAAMAVVSLLGAAAVIRKK